MTPALDWFALAFGGVASTPGGWGEPLLIAASGGILGMGLSDITSGLTDRFSGGGGEDLDSSGGDDFFGDGGDFDDGFGDDLGADGFGDDLGNVDDWDDGDDFDDFDDFGDGGSGGGSNVDPRIEELENEVASLSSTMGTVRSENEAIQESVEDIEDNIRKLLEIYEMVTRGVNPFVDEPQAGGGVGGSFGLFDDAGDDGYDDLDPEVADADPDSFFDDDFDDAGFEDDEFEAEDFADDASEDPPFDDDVLGDDDFLGDAEAGEGGGGNDGDGKTFDELKSEYQADDGWDDADGREEPSDAATAVADEGTTTPGDAAEPSVAGNDGQGGQSADTRSEADGSTVDAPPGHGTAGSDGGDASDAGGPRDDKPYLEALPAGYGAELLVVEWLTYLRRHSSTSEALRAIKYYETIGWIGSAAADSLQRYLSGLAADDVASSQSGGTQLTIDHHTDSLHYIGKLGGTDVDVERLEWSGPARSAGRIERRGQRGIQR